MCSSVQVTKVKLTHGSVGKEPVHAEVMLTSELAEISSSNKIGGEV